MLEMKLFINWSSLQSTILQPLMHFYQENVWLLTNNAGH